VKSSEISSNQSQSHTAFKNTESKHELTQTTPKQQQQQQQLLSTPSTHSKYSYIQPQSSQSKQQTLEKFTSHKIDTVENQFQEELQKFAKTMEKVQLIRVCFMFSFR
jgi:hypothetical protein